jgi:hypothetical protein
MKNILVIALSCGVIFPLTAQDTVAQKLYTELRTRIRPIIEQFAFTLTDREIQAYLTAFRYGNQEIEIQEVLLPSKNRWENSILPSIHEVGITLGEEIALLDTTKSVGDWQLVCLLLSNFTLYNWLYKYAVTKNIEPCYLNVLYDASIPLPSPRAFNAELVAQLHKKSIEQQLQNYAPSSTSVIL